MIIREPKVDETDKIIQLLQSSLGDSLLKKSTKIWNFKHIENPFGVSPVLVAEDDGSLIGVRAFMQWRWQLQDKIWVSYRAVDTATHPKHQGKGVFKTLTLSALDAVQKLSEGFVFNTPNDKSRPGYLKMGWQQVGKIKVALVPTILYFFTYLFSRNQFSHNIKLLELENICEKHNANLATKNILFTPKSVTYLKWRYEENPLQRYIIVSSSNWYVAMYIKKHRFFNELRVVETIGALDKKNEIRQAIVRYAFQNSCSLITTANKDLFALQLYGNYGPMLTFKSLTTSKEFVQKALCIENWSYSTGDLELF